MLVGSAGIEAEARIMARAKLTGALTPLIPPRVRRGRNKGAAWDPPTAVPSSARPASSASDTCAIAMAAAAEFDKPSDDDASAATGSNGELSPSSSAARRRDWRSYLCGRAGGQAHAMSTRADRVRARG